MRSPPCPCSSALPYARCCAPYHLGAEAPTPVALMRSRYAGFALKKVDYLWRTLHPEHPDRAEPEAVGLASLRATCERLKYPGLRIVDTREAGPRGLPEVLFYARMFERGVDRSFVECSAFARDQLGWRYRDGVLVAPRDVGDPASWSFARIDALG